MSPPAHHTARPTDSSRSEQTLRSRTCIYNIGDGKALVEEGYGNDPCLLKPLNETLVSLYCLS